MPTKTKMVRGRNKRKSQEVSGHATNEDPSGTTRRHHKARSDVRQRINSSSDSSDDDKSDDENELKERSNVSRPSSLMTGAAALAALNGRVRNDANAKDVSASPVETETREEQITGVAGGLSGGVHLTDNDVDVIVSFCKNTLFRKVKFISHDMQMVCGGKICNYVLDGVNCRSTHRGDTWKLVQHNVKRTITQKRNNVSGEIKKAFKSK